jgi:hypothetical protein
MPETRGKTLEEIEAAFGNEIPNDGLVLTTRRKCRAS